MSFKRKPKSSTRLLGELVWPICRLLVCLLSGSLLCSVSAEGLFLANHIARASLSVIPRYVQPIRGTGTERKEKPREFSPFLSLGRGGCTGSRGCFSSVFPALIRQHFLHGPKFCLPSLRNFPLSPSGSCFWAAVRIRHFFILPFPRGVAAACIY